MKDAACKDHPEVPASSWLDKAENSFWSRKAIEVCQTECPVRNQCLEWVLRVEARQRPRWGIYGGVTPRKRERMTPV